MSFVDTDLGRLDKDIRRSITDEEDESSSCKWEPFLLLLLTSTKDQYYKTDFDVKHLPILVHDLSLYQM